MAINDGGAAPTKTTHLVPLGFGDARYKRATRLVQIDSFAGSDPTGATDSTAAFQLALAALPTVAVWASASIPGAPGGGGTVSGTTANFKVGTIELGVGTYRIGTSGDIGNLGPFVSVRGQGHHSTTLDYRGTGSCLRAYNTVRPSSDTFFALNGMGGHFDRMTIAGENSTGVGAVGLHLGDAEGYTLGPDLFVRNFSVTNGAAPTSPTVGTTTTTGGTLTAQAYSWRITALYGASAATESAPTAIVSKTLTGTTNQQALSWTAAAGATGYRIYRSSTSDGVVVAGIVGAVTTYTDTGTSASGNIYSWPNGIAGGTGILFDNSYAWTENVRGWATVMNCTNAVVFNGSNGTVVQNGYTGGDNSFMYNDLTFKLYGYATQNGVVFANGATYQGGRLIITANMQNNYATTTNALMRFGLPGLTGHLGGATWANITNSTLEIRAETNGGGTYNPQTINFFNGANVIGNCTGILSFNGNWLATNYTLAATYANSSFQFLGVIQGDVNLAGANGNNSSQAFYYGLTTLFSNGGLPMNTGDIATVLTLSASMTVAFQNNRGGAQRKTVFIKQNATTAYTVTWPKNSTPTLASPTILWAGGTAPTMTATLGRTDMYEFTTADGLTWFGKATQNMY